MATLELVVSEFIILALVCFFLINHYKGNMVTIDVAVAVYLSWVLGFAGILLLPYDLSVAIVDEQQGDMLEKVWNFIYWSTFVLAWVVLPMQMEYHNSGQFTFTEKIKDALRKNVWSGVLAAVAGLVYVAYMMFTRSGSLSQVIGFIKAMGNTYGILLITVLMGNGLVGLPRRMWYYADPEMELNWLYMMASSVETTYQEARFELEDCEWDVSKAAEKIRKSNLSPNDPVSTGEYVLILQQSVANFTFLGRSTTRNYVSRTVEGSNVSDPKQLLVQLHARLKQAQIRARACARRWKQLVQQSERAEINLADETNGEGDDSSNCFLMHTSIIPDRMLGAAQVKSTLFQSDASPWYAAMMHSFSQILNTKYMKISSRIFSVICGIVSVIILWSEVVMATEWRSPVGYLMGAYSPSRDKNAVVMQAVSFLALSYMSICTYWSLFRLNLGWAYTLQGPQLSPPSSLIFNGEYFSRLQFALGYNFLMFSNVPRTRLTSFDGLMSNMNMVPVFGTSFQIYIPIVMLIVALMTLFNVNSRVLRLIGVESDDVYVQTGSFMTRCWHTRTKVALNDEDLERYEAGKKLVTSELRSAAQSLNNSQNSSTKTSRFSNPSHPSRSNSRMFDNSCISRGEKDEAPYRDEEPEDYGSEIEMDGSLISNDRKDGRHKKSSSINYLANQVNPMNSMSKEKYLNIESQNNSKLNSISNESNSTSNSWFARTLTEKLSKAFTSMPANLFSQGAPLNRSEIINEDEVTTHGVGIHGIGNGVGNSGGNYKPVVVKGGNIATSSYRGNEELELANHLSRLRGESKTDSRIRPSSEPFKKGPNNFAADVEPEFVRRYANV